MITSLGTTADSLAHETATWNATTYGEDAFPVYVLVYSWLLAHCESDGDLEKIAGRSYREIMALVHRSLGA